MPDDFQSNNPFIPPTPPAEPTKPAPTAPTQPENGGNSGAEGGEGTKPTPPVEPKVIGWDDKNPHARDTKANKNEGDDGVLPEDKKFIEDKINTGLDPLRIENNELKIRSEIMEFVDDNPEYRPYKEQIMKFKSHPSGAYANIPAEYIARIVSFNDQQKLGAEKERLAQQRAQETQGVGGSSTRKEGSGEKNWLNASKEDFEAHKRQALQNASN